MIPIAYTYEADYHCPFCTIQRFGADKDGYPYEDARDREGNSIGAVFSLDEWYEPSVVAVQVLACSDCGLELRRYEPLDLIEESARAEGYDAGVAAGTWLLDGNSSEAAARRLLDGIADGVPMVLDTLPSSPLSGEWADAPLPRDILQAFGVTAADPYADDILRAYEDGFDQGVTDEALRMARVMLGEQQVTS